METFLAVAEELHFGRAATRLGMAQPPLSRRIQRFERELGAQLFERDRRRVRLTPAGAALVPRARAILAEAARAEQVARDTAAGLLGVVRLGFVGTAALSILPQLVRDFRSAYPQVGLELSELTTARQLTALGNGELDIGLVRAHAPRTELESLTLLTEALLVAMPASHTLASLTSIPVARLRDEPFVLFPRIEGSGLHEQITAHCRAAGFEPRVAQEATTMSTIIGLVASGIGVSIVPASVSHIRLPGVAYRELSASGGDVGLRLVWHHRDMSPATIRFVELARGHAGP